jgi:hypothetical protein
LSRALALDFAAREDRPPGAGIVLLAAGLALCGLLALHFRERLAERARIEERIEALQASSRPSRAAAPAGAEGAAELRGAQRVLAQLQTPWRGLFSTIEASIGDKVALLGVQPDPANARVTLTAEAKDLQEALWFAQRLSAGGELADAFLTGHEMRRDGAQRLARVTIVGRWPAMEGRAEKQP